MTEPKTCPICHKTALERSPTQVLDYSPSTPMWFDVWRCRSGSCEDTRVMLPVRPAVVTALPQATIDLVDARINESMAALDVQATQIAFREKKTDD